MSQLRDRIIESREHARREAAALPPEQARARRAAGVEEVRRLIDGGSGVPLRATPESERTAAILRALSEGGR